MTAEVKKMLISQANKDYLKAVERRKREERELREEMMRKMEEDDEHCADRSNPGQLSDE